MNKQISFDPKLIESILSGKKQATWRLNDKRNLTMGDICDFINSETDEKFAVAKLTEIIEKPFGDLTLPDKGGHEPYESDKEMYKVFEGYYNQPVGPETVVKIARFELIEPTEKFSHRPKLRTTFYP